MSSEAVKLAREKRRAARDERNWQREQLFYDRVLTPNVVRLLLIGGIIAYSTYVTRSKEKQGPIASALAYAGPGIGIPVIAAEAGITDKYALAAISAAGLGYTGLSMVQGWQEYGQRSGLEAIVGAVGPFLGPLGFPAVSLLELTK